MTGIDAVHAVGQPVAGVAVAAPPEKAAEIKQVIQAVKAINATGMMGQDSELTFAMDAQTHRPVVRIVDTKTNQVIEQLPPEAVLAMAADLDRPGQLG
jgi:uncharacterized FlaG/YvyC family protein